MEMMEKFSNLREALEDYLAMVNKGGESMPEMIMAERIAFLIGALSAHGLRERGINVSNDAVLLLEEIKNDPAFDIFREGGNA